MDLTSLTLREYQIVDLMRKGYTAQEISDEVGIAMRTVVTHTYRIYNKLGVHSRAALVAKLSNVDFFKGNSNEAKAPETDRAV